MHKPRGKHQASTSSCRPPSSKLQRGAIERLHLASNLDGLPIDPAAPVPVSDSPVRPSAIDEHMGAHPPTRSCARVFQVGMRGRTRKFREGAYTWHPT